MYGLIALLIVCSNIYMSTKIVQGQSLLKRVDQSSTQRFEDIERKLANNIQQNIELVRKVDDVNNEWLLKFERQNTSSSQKIQELERKLERQNENSSLKIQELERRLASNVQQKRQLERRLESVNNDWLLKFREFERQNTSSLLKSQALERRLELINNEWPTKFQDFDRQLAGNVNL